MKKILNENKVLVIGGVLMVLFVGLLFWPQKKETPIQKQPVIKQKELIGLPRKAEIVDWSKSEISLPNKMAILESKNNPITSDQVGLIKKAVGMEGVGITKSADNYEVFENDKAVLYVLFNEREINYEIKNKLAYKGEKDSTKALSNFNALVSKLSINNQLTNPKVDYLKDDYRAVKTDINSADYLEITTTSTYNGILMLNYLGEPQIKAEYNFDGDLGGLTIYNAFDEITEGKMSTIASVESLRQTPAAEMPIFSEDGGKEFVMSTGDEEIKTIVAGPGKLGYVFNKSDFTYQPYYLNEGQTTLNTGLINITFGVPLIK